MDRLLKALSKIIHETDLKYARLPTNTHGLQVNSHMDGTAPRMLHSNNNSFKKLTAQ